MSEVENDAYRRQAERDAAKRQVRDDRDSALYRSEHPRVVSTTREGSGALRSDSVRSEDASRHCPLCGGTDHTITGANRVTSIGIDWGARFKCGNCGAGFR